MKKKEVRVSDPGLKTEGLDVRVCIHGLGSSIAGLGLRSKG